MRQALPTLIILLVCIALLAAYFFGGKPQLDKQVRNLRAENDRLSAEIDSLNRMKLEIPELIKQLPEWKQQLELFKTAIPGNIDDEIFLAKLAEQMSQRGVELVSVELAPGGPWLGNINEDERERLKGIGVDVEAAMAVKTADYTVKLNGEFGKIVQAFENLKSYRRLYTLDEFAGPAVGTGGAVTATLDQVNTPIMVAGRLYYGLPEGGLGDKQIDDVIAQILMSPAAMRLKRGISETGGALVAPGAGAGKRRQSSNAAGDGTEQPAESSTEAGSTT